MLKIISRMGMVFAGCVLAAILAGQCGLWSGRTPTDLGVRAGRLKPPSLTENSVSSQAVLYPGHPQQAYAAIEPLRYDGSGAQAMQRLAEVLRKTERTEIVIQKSDYLYAQCTTRFMRFTDDVEFWLDEMHGVIQVRSASRLGTKDLGTNRHRIETIRAQFQRN